MSAADPLVGQLCNAVLAGENDRAQLIAREIQHGRISRPPGAKKPTVLCWFDGSCATNPGGHSGYGALVKRNGVTILSASVYLGHGPHLTNNVAEYAGMIRVLRFLISEGIQWATIYGDSRLVIDQLSGKIKAKHGVYLPHFREARELLQRLPEVNLKWISRGQNTEADLLSRAALPKLT